VDGHLVAVIALLLPACAALAHEAPTVVRSPGEHPRPIVVAILPFQFTVTRAEQSHADRAAWNAEAELWKGCAEGVAASGVSVVRREQVDAAIVAQELDVANDASVSSSGGAVGKAVGADMIIVGVADQEKFDAVLDARLVRAASGAVEATAHAENQKLFDGAKETCSAMVSRVGAK